MMPQNEKRRISAESGCVPGYADGFWILQSGDFSVYIGKAVDIIFRQLYNK